MGLGTEHSLPEDPCRRQGTAAGGMRLQQWPCLPLRREQLQPLGSQSTPCLNRRSQHPVTYFKLEQPPGELWFDLSSQLWALL